MENELREKLKELEERGIDIDDDLADSQASGVKTPESERCSEDSFMQRDPRNKLFSFKKLREDQEKEKKYEDGEEMPRKSDNFKDMRFR